MSLEHTKPTKEEMEYLHGFSNLLESEEFLAHQIMDPNCNGDPWNEHKLRVEAILQGQNLTKGEV